MKIRNQEKQAIANTIESNGLKLSDFEIKDEDWVFTLKFIGSGLRFSFKMSPDSFNQFSFGGTNNNPSWTSFDQHQKWIHFADVLSNFDKWIKRQVGDHVRELNTPDPWLHIKQMFSNYSNADDDKPFTTEEKNVLVDNLGRLPAELSKQFEQLESHLVIRLESTLKEVTVLIEGNAKRGYVRKFLFGAIAEFVIQATLESEPVKAIAVDIFNFAIDFIIKLRLLPPIPITPLLGM